MEKDRLKLPSGYRLVREVDVQKNKKLSVWLNVVPLFVVAGMIIGALVLRKPEGPVEMNNTILFIFLGTTLVAVLQMKVHVWIHGIFIHYFCGEKPQHGFNGRHVYTGQKDAYFSKSHYIVIALAPVVLLGALLLVLNFLFPVWFWAIYFLQAVNLSNAVANLYVTALLSKLPADTLCNDDGLSVRFYSASEVTLLGW